MRAAPLSRGALLFLLASLPAGAACLPIEKAADHVGATACVAGKVVRVNEGKGAWFVNFCEDYRTCPFTVVVFAKDLRDVGDVRQLAGKTIEVHGHIRLYRGRPEIILRDARQLRGEAAKLPPPPPAYEASKRGSYSAGEFKSSKSSRKTARSRRNSRSRPVTGEENTTGDRPPE